MSAIQAAKSALDAIRESRQAINLEIDNLTSKISAIGDKKRKLQNATLSLGDYGNYLSDEIKRRGERYASLWLGSRQAKSSAGSTVSHSLMRWPDFEAREVGKLLEEVMPPESMGDALCFLFPDLIHGKLMDCLSKHQAGDWASGDKSELAERKVLIKAAETEENQLKQERNNLFSQLGEINAALQSQ